MKKTWILIIVILFTVSSCAYFNTFYNTQVLFNESQALVAEQEPGAELPRNVRDNLEAAAAKAKKVIEKFPESRYVDESMFYFGVTNYQLGKFFLSKAMFGRLITEYPDSPYFAEANLWIARCNYSLGETGLAFSRIEEFIADGKNNAFRAEAYLLAGELSKNHGDTLQSLDYYRKAAQYAHSEEDQSRALYQLALFQIERGELDVAREELENVKQLSLDPKVQGRVQLQFAIIYRLQKQYELSRELIKEMLADPAQEDIWGQLELELAQTYLNVGEIDLAIERYNSIQETYIRKPEAAVAAYQLGEIYLFQRKDFDKAKDNYKKVKAHNRTGLEAVKAQSRTALIETYQKLLGEQNKITANMPVILTSPFTTYQTLKDSASADSTVISALDTYRLQADKFLKNRLSQAEVLAFNMALYDSAITIYHYLADSFSFSPLMPQVYGAWGYVLSEELGDTLLGNEVYDYLLSQYPNSEFARYLRGETEQNGDDEIDSYAMQALFQVEQRYLDRQQYDSALVKLEVLEKEAPDSLDKVRILYQMAWIYDEAISNLDSSIVFYQRITDHYAQTPYGLRSKSRLMELSNILNMTVEDSTLSGNNKPRTREDTTKTE